MNQLKYYTGIGSRSATFAILSKMEYYAIRLSEMNYCLRSGRAKGSDQAFEKGANSKEIFTFRDAQPWAYEEVLKHMPNDRPSFDTFSDYVKGLLARNMMQVLGKDGNSPVEFVLCWAPSLEYTDSSAGGTGYAIRCAIAHGIPVYNLFEEGTEERFEIDFKK